MEINGLEEPRDLPAPNIKLTKYEAIAALNTVEEVKAKTGKDKVIVVQPFGRGVEVQGEYIIDATSRFPLKLILLILSIILGKIMRLLS